MKRLACIAFSFSMLLVLFAPGCGNDDSAVTPTASTQELGLARSSGGGVQVEATVGIATHFSMKTTTEGCTNHPGPYISLVGEVSLGGLDGLLIFRNNVKGTHEREEDVTASLVLVPEGETITFAKQPPLGGAGGNPWIYLQLLDGSGNAITDEILLGRCVQGLMETDLDFLMTAPAHADVSAADCANSPGPQITVTGELVLGGLDARLIFRNNEKGTHEHIEETEVSITILPKDETIVFAKQPPLGGVGGNPRIYFAFADDDGNAISSEFYLGRCVQLSK